MVQVSWCKRNPEKAKAISDKWRKNNREKSRASTEKWRRENPEKNRESKLKTNRKLMGLTMEQYDDLLERQDGKCAIVGCTVRPGTTSHPKSLHIDHDRSCCPVGRACVKCVRGLLCWSCNVSIGRFGDDPDRLRAAADYLKRERPFTVGGLK